MLAKAFRMSGEDVENDKINKELSRSHKSNGERMTFDKNRIYLFDGGFATHLTTVMNDETLISDPLWSCGALQRDPKAVIQTHQDFVEAGSDIVGTNTYQADVGLFRKHMRLNDPALDPHLLIESAPDLARQAFPKAGKKAGLVAGSIGPYGACLGDGSEYTGNYIDSEGLTEDEMRCKLRKWHADRIKRLTVGGVDFFAVETLPSVVEALAILDALEEVPGSRCWISFQCREGGMSTARGEALEHVLTQLLLHPAFRFKVLAVGANCVHPKDVETILQQFNKVNHWSKWPSVLNYEKVPYVVYPNAGRPYDPVKKCFVNEKHLGDILDNVRTWITLGANVIGGCCEVSPSDIRQIADKVFTELFDALEDRAEIQDRTRDNRDEWAQVQERLKKPSYDDLKKKQEQKSGFVKDLTGDGGVGGFSRLHHEVESAILEEEKNCAG